MAKRDPCETDDRLGLWEIVAYKGKTTEDYEELRAVAATFLFCGDYEPERDTLARRVAKLMATNHDLRQKVYCAGHRCFECGYMVGMGNCTFQWKAARIARRAKE